MTTLPVKVLFVCMGNICRSPTAEAVFAAIVAEQGLEAQIHTDSAGTHAYHIGNPPDSRSTKAAEKSGIKMSHLRARQVTERDFYDFDYILAMDGDNLSDLLSICPEAQQPKVSLLLAHVEGIEQLFVPDPYYGGPQGFEQVIELVGYGAEALLKTIKKEFV